MSAEPTDASNAPPEGLSENELAVEGHDAPGASKAVVPAAPLTLANFLVHPRFYTQVANYFVFPFLSGVCYAFGECYARVLMGRWGYLPVVVGKKTGKVVTSLGNGVLAETGLDHREATAVAAALPMEGIMFRSMLFGTLSGGIFGYNTAKQSSGSSRKRTKRTRKQALQEE